MPIINGQDTTGWTAQQTQDYQRYQSDPNGFQSSTWDAARGMPGTWGADNKYTPKPVTPVMNAPAPPGASGGPFVVGGSVSGQPGIIASAASPTAAPATPGSGSPTGGSKLQDFYNANKNNPAAVAKYLADNGISRADAAQQMGIDQGYVDHYLDGNPAPAPGTSGIVAGATQPSSSSTFTASSTQPAQLGTPTQWNVTAPQTVEGRLASIINPNNPIIQQAQAQARIDAAGRGFQNTSMAETAGQAAAYQAAIPIAQADAATAAKAAGYNADQANAFAIKNADSANQFGLTDKQIAGQTGIAGMQIAGQKDIAALNSQTQMAIGKMNVDAQAIANKLQADNTKLINTNGQAAQAFNQAVAAVNNINLSTTMDAAHKTQAVAQVWNSVQSQLKVLGAVSGLDLTSTLSLANTPGFDDKGNWIGFPATADTTSAPAPAPAPANSY